MSATEAAAPQTVHGQFPVLHRAMTGEDNTLAKLFSLANFLYSIRFLQGVNNFGHHLIGVLSQRAASSSSLMPASAISRH